MSNGLTKRRPGGTGMGYLASKGLRMYTDLARRPDKTAVWQGTTTGRMPSAYNNLIAQAAQAISGQVCVERWVFKDSQCIEVPASYDHKAMAVDYRMLPVMERWSHQRQWRYVQYNYLGAKDLRESAVPPEFKALQLIL